MKTDIVSIIIFIIVLIALIILFKYQIKCSFRLSHFENPYQENLEKINNLTPYESKELADLTIKINKDNYQKYLKNKEFVEENNSLDNNNNNNNIDFGYSIIKDTNTDSLGFCPLGSYFKEKYDIKTIKNIDVFTKCKKCYQCNKNKEGWYTSGGCLGDKDSKCQNENIKKLPHSKYIKAHGYPFLLHNQLPKHKHQYDFTKNKEKYYDGMTDEQWNKKLTNTNHNHIKIL